jgi:glycerophosphoryl diester phosphodiesterase
MKLLTGIFFCAGFAAVITGAVIFFAHLYAARQETRVEAPDIIKLSTVAGIEDKSDIILCAHRGFSAAAPENTVAAINAAGEAGFSYVEFDVQETKDGILVLMHDKKINRMTDGKGLVSSYTLKELFSFNIDNGADFKKYGTLKIPTLSQALAACSNYGISPVIEMKRISIKGVEKLSSFLPEYSFDKAAVSSFDKKKLEAFGKINKNAELWLLSPELSDEDIEYCEKFTGTVLSFDTAAAKDTAVISEIAEKGIEMTCWTVNDAQTLKALYDRGIRRFTTDNILPLKKD